MELWGRMLWALLSGPGRGGSTLGWAFSSWQPQPPLAGLSSATELVSHWTRVFEKRGIPEARESSEYIVAHVLGAKTFQSLRPALWTQPLTSQQLQCIQELSSRRLQRMPVQYILGEWDFQGLSLRMVPPVFIPRPETEELVEWVLEEVAQRSYAVGSPGSPLILEVGCGSGAISLSLLSQLPQSRVIAVDKGEAAISLTHENAQRLQLQDRIWIIHLDMTSERSWTHLPWGPVDLVVSNPPYIFHQDMEQLAPEIRSYEDPAALDGGEEGMDIITHILALAPQLLKDSGSIFLEVDPRHPELVSSWLQSRPELYLNLVAVRKDFCGRSPDPLLPGSARARVSFCPSRAGHQSPAW
ncbi:PREDICTED: hemK methyltransferase family member 1 isoform X2 [Cercocebus atys]|uniref:hemK methyltransferase family member 1 isoform X2 n=1 Tax=Cercocebus atys TaxID=9531 RepID=UPI0005F3F912|nr:PREDICTED: hemK methyltransferase family member 1 isoform X2 [Cercocebus atys]